MIFTGKSCYINGYFDLMIIAKLLPPCPENGMQGIY